MMPRRTCAFSHSQVNIHFLPRIIRTPFPPLCRCIVFPFFSFRCLPGRTHWLLWQGWSQDSMGPRHPLRDGDTPGLRNPPELRREATRLRGEEGLTSREHGHRCDSRRNGVSGDQSDGHGEDTDDDLAGAVRVSHGCGMESAEG